MQEKHSSYHLFVEALELCLTGNNSIFNNFLAQLKDHTYRAPIQILLWEILIRKL